MFLSGLVTAYDVRRHTASKTKNMAEDSEKSKGIASIVHAFIAFIPHELREMVGFFTGFVLMMVVPAVVVMGAITMYHFMQKSKESSVACWQIQSNAQRTFKLNTCTGEMAEVPASYTSAPSTSAGGPKP